MTRPRHRILCTAVAEIKQKYDLKERGLASATRVKPSRPRFLDDLCALRCFVCIIWTGKLHWRTTIVEQALVRHLHRFLRRQSLRRQLRDLGKTDTQHLDSIAPRVRRIHAFDTITNRIRRPPNPLAASRNDFLHKSIRIRVCQADVKPAAAIVFELRRRHAWRVDELHDFEPYIVAGSHHGYFDLLEARWVHFEDRGVRGLVALEVVDRLADELEAAYVRVECDCVDDGGD